MKGGRKVDIEEAVSTFNFISFLKYKRLFDYFLLASFLAAALGNTTLFCFSCLYRECIVLFCLMFFNLKVFQYDWYMYSCLLLIYSNPPLSYGFLLCIYCEIFLSHSYPSGFLFKNFRHINIRQCITYQLLHISYCIITYYIFTSQQR